MNLAFFLGWMLAGVGAVSGVFVLWAWRVGTCHARIAEAGARRLRIRADWRVGATLVALASVGLLALALLLMTAHPPKPDEPEFLGWTCRFCTRAPSPAAPRRPLQEGEAKSIPSPSGRGAGVREQPVLTGFALNKRCPTEESRINQ